MIYNWPLMTHIYVMLAKLIFFEVVLCEISLMEQLFIKKFFFRTRTISGKNDVQLTFDDSYIYIYIYIIYMYVYIYKYIYIYIYIYIMWENWCFSK